MAGLEDLPPELRGRIVGMLPPEERQRMAEEFEFTPEEYAELPIVLTRENIHFYLKEPVQHVRELRVFGPINAEDLTKLCEILEGGWTMNSVYIWNIKLDACNAKRMFENFAGAESITLNDVYIETIPEDYLGRSLRELTITNMRHEKQMNWDEIAGFMKRQRLEDKVLNLRMNYEIGIDRVVQKIVETSGPDIETLDFSGSIPSTGDNAEGLALDELRPLAGHVRHLYLNNNLIKDEAIPTLVYLMERGNLKTLSLEKNFLKDTERLEEVAMENGVDLILGKQQEIIQ